MSTALFEAIEHLPQAAHGTRILPRSGPNCRGKLLHLILRNLVSVNGTNANRGALKMRYCCLGNGNLPFINLVLKSLQCGTAGLITGPACPSLAPRVGRDKNFGSIKLIEWQSE